MRIRPRPTRYPRNLLLPACQTAIELPNQRSRDPETLRPSAECLQNVPKRPPEPPALSRHFVVIRISATNIYLKVEIDQHRSPSPWGFFLFNCLPLTPEVLAPFTIHLIFSLTVEKTMASFHRKLFLVCIGIASLCGIFASMWRTGLSPHHQRMHPPLMSKSIVEKEEHLTNVWTDDCWADGICVKPDPTTRIDLDGVGSLTNTILCWPSVGGMIIVDSISGVEFQYLGLDNLAFNQRSYNATEEDHFCQGLRRIGGKCGRATMSGHGRHKCSCVACPQLRRKSYT